MNEKNRETPHLTSPLKREKDKKKRESHFSLSPEKGEGRVRVMKLSAQLVRELRKNQTDAEKNLWLLLRNRRFEGLKFRRQYRTGSFVVDFCCIEKKLIIE